MGDVTAPELGARIREARTRADMTQDELARHVGLDRTAINRIESGTRKVAALELSDIAGVLGVRMAAFFLEPAAAVAQHRSSQGLDTVDSRIDALLASISDEVRFVRSLTPLPTRSTKAWDHPRTRDDAEAMAARARDALGVDDDAPLTGLASRLWPLGFFLFGKHLGPDTADAGMLLLDDCGIGFVNSSAKVGRRRLAAVHELGHFLVQDAYTVDWRVAEDELHHESRLDHFARAALLPAEAVVRRWEDLCGRSGLRAAAVVLASEYRVDMTTLARRLRELDVIGVAEAGEVRTVRTTRSDIIEFDLHHDDELAADTQPREFEKAVLALVRDDRISRERALDLLWGIASADELPEPRRRDERSIWEFVS